MPFGDPETMFERMFGPPSQEEKQALAKIDVSVREERQMGQAALDAYIASLRAQNIPLIRTGNDIDYLRRLVATLQPLMANRRRYPTIQVLLADSPVVDARTFPGGTILFFRGLLDSAGNEAALVGIIGHELAHLDRGHVLDRAKRMKLAQQTFSSGPRGMSLGQFFNLATTSMRMWTRPFQPEDEAEADLEGAGWPTGRATIRGRWPGCSCRSRIGKAGNRRPCPRSSRAIPPPPTATRRSWTSTTNSKRRSPNKGSPSARKISSGASPARSGNSPSERTPVVEWGSRTRPTQLSDRRQVLTSIFRGWADSSLGTVRRKTPSLYVASIRSASTDSSKGIARWNSPYCDSTRR